MSAISSGCSFGNALYSQRPVFDKRGRRRPWANTVKGRKINRPDKRVKTHYLK